MLIYSIPYSRIIAIFTAIFLFSCKTIQVNDNRPFVRLTDDSQFFLLPPENIEKSMDSFQFLYVSYGENSFYANVWVIADEKGIDMSMMNDMGANIGELVWRDGLISFSSNIFPMSMPPEYIIADFQLCFYNALSLKSALEKIGLSFIETNNIRRILKNGNVITEITKNNNMVTIANYLRGYHFSLEGNFE